MWYPPHEVLFILLTAVIRGATSYARVEMFGRERKEWLSKYLKLEHGIPDAGTFRYVLMTLDPAKLHTVFVDWMRSAVEKVTGVVAIDGKQARRTGDTGQRREKWADLAGIGLIRSAVKQNGAVTRNESYFIYSCNVLRQVAFNELKSDTKTKGGFMDKQYKCMLNSDYLDSVLSWWVCS